MRPAIAYVYSLLYLGILAVSFRLYDHRGRRYAEDKTAKIEESRAFALLSPWLGLGAYLTAALHPFFSSAPTTILGPALTLLGFGVFAWAKLSLARNYSPCFDSYVPESITDVGPYRVLRHPIYFGNIIAFFGALIYTSSALVLVSLGLLWWFYARSARREEAALRVAFPTYQEAANQRLGFPGRWKV